MSAHDLRRRVRMLFRRARTTLVDEPRIEWEVRRIESDLLRKQTLTTGVAVIGRRLEWGTAA